MPRKRKAKDYFGTQKGDAVAGLVVGLYVAPQLVGIATHPGERTHSHWVSTDRTTTTHLDAWGIKSGANLGRRRLHLRKT